jgi:putative transposase
LKKSRLPTVGWVGTPVPELCWSPSISSATFYKWRAKYDGIDASLILQMKAVEEENRRLQKGFSEVQMSAEILKEPPQKMVRPSQRREMAR